MKKLDLISQFQEEINRLYELDRNKFYEIKDILEKMTQENNSKTKDE